MLRSIEEDTSELLVDAPNELGVNVEALLATIVFGSRLPDRSSSTHEFQLADRVDASRFRALSGDSGRRRFIVMVSLHLDCWRGGYLLELV